MADPDPAPQPTPFPIRIVQNDPPSSSSLDIPDVPSGKRTDEFYPAWDKFLATQPKRAKKMSKVVRKTVEEQKEVEQSPSDGLTVKENASSSWEQAAAECKKKVDAIILECKRLNQKYRDAIFDLEASPWCLPSLTGRYPDAVDDIGSPPWIKRVQDIFDKPQFFIDGANATDVHQGLNGDCWFLAALMAVSAKKELIDRLCVARDEEVGVYGFVFYRDGEWIYEVIDDKLFLRVGDDDDITVVRDWQKKEQKPLRYDNDKLKAALQKGAEALYFSHCKSDETWLPLIEKAYAKAHGDYYAIEGGFASEGIEDLTGGVGVALNPEDIMDKDRFWKEQLSQVNEKYLFGGGSKQVDSKNIFGGHAYAVLRTYEEGDLRLLQLRNPWGKGEYNGDWSDGSKMWTPEMMTKLGHTFGDDGIFWMSYADFLKHFPEINRVRLFSNEWSVAQQWTCVNVPWTVEYLDTKFQIEVSKKGPVVIVLCQPDDRYFYGLQGRYFYSLHFRVYKEGDDDERWIVRSMHNSGNESTVTRSVSAEIEDLEPGTYNVVFKVTAIRAGGSPTAQESIMKYAVNSKEKLLYVGRRYDYAQSKGDLKGMEEANRKRAEQDAKLAQKTTWKRSRKISKKERELARKRKQRVDDAMREKRKTFKAQQREKAKAKGKGKQADTKTCDGSMDAQATADDSDNKSTTPSNGDSGVLVEAADTAAASKTGTNESSQGTEGAEAQKQKEQEVAKSDVKQPDTSKGDTEDPASRTTTGDSKTASGAKDVPNPQPAKATEDLSSRLSTLNIQSQASAVGPVSPLTPAPKDDEADEDSDSTVSPPSELDDNDFDWDSEIDGPASLDSDEEDDMPATQSDAKNEIFGDDLWDAKVVLGLRVYAMSEVKVQVIKGERDS